MAGPNIILNSVSKTDVDTLWTGRRGGGQFGRRVKSCLGMSSIVWSRLVMTASPEVTDSQ
jgi:hypothetical protein